MDALEIDEAGSLPGIDEAGSLPTPPTPLYDAMTLVALSAVTPGEVAA